tara:strand:+ start:274 stop:459 length:186 start_codon:yes stop_codon:yes gene_type:complete
MKGFIIVLTLLGIFLIAGEVKCIIKAVNCNWKPIGKAEVIYTASAFTGAGCIVGWINIEDK